MNKRNREINVFNLSMLDVICGAMGSFLIIMMLLFIFYSPTEALKRCMRENTRLQGELDECHGQLHDCQQENARLEGELSDCQEQNNSLRGQLNDCQTENSRLRGQLGPCEQERDRLERENAVLQQENSRLRELLEKTYLIMVINWYTRDDVDLHVIDPVGHEFYFDQKTFSGVPGELTEDITVGPGVEMWELPDNAPAGQYKIYYNWYAKKDTTAPTVKGRLIYRDGRHIFREIQLTEVGNKLLVATVTVAADGSVSVR